MADEGGLLAIGGDLSPERLLLAYSEGIFPWYSSGEPIQWWSPDPRMVLYPSQLYISKSMKKVMRSNIFRISFDVDFRAVIQNCQKISRHGQYGTWITPHMIHAYLHLHELGFAHSVEVYNSRSNALVGGLYGVSLGACFFGESMFSHESNASKAGFIYLVEYLKTLHFSLIDCQIYTEHLASLGSTLIDRALFLQKLKEGLIAPTQRGKWFCPENLSFL